MPSRNQATGNKRGAILFGILLVVLMVSLIGASLAALLSSLALRNQFEVAQAKALYLAEAGVSQTIHLLQSGLIIVTEQEDFIPSTPLGDGSYEVKLDLPQSLITSIGKVGGVKRKIQLKYNSF